MGTEGFEPPTPRSSVVHSPGLSYVPVNNKKISLFKKVYMISSSIAFLTSGAGSPGVTSNLPNFPAEIEIFP